MKKISVCVLFGGVSPEHKVSLRSAESVLSNMDTERFTVLPVGITKAGKWILFGSDRYDLLPSGRWESCTENCEAVLSPVRGQGLLVARNGGYEAVPVDAVFPVLHGENGEDGSVQGLLQLTGIPYVGAGVAASAVAMDKTLTKLVADSRGIVQADWVLVTSEELRQIETAVTRVEEKFRYPVFVKPASTGSSVGVSKACDRATLIAALYEAGKYGPKILVEECIVGKEIEVAVMGNENPMASVCGEIVSGAEFYDYDAKYVNDTSVAYIPAPLDEKVSEQVREIAVKVFTSVGCKGLSRVDFFVTPENRVVLNEINTLPGFTSISMYPKLFIAGGMPYGEIITKLITLALEAQS